MTTAVESMKSWRDDLRARLSSANVLRFPAHVTNRLAVLLHAEPLEFVYPDIRREHYDLNGTLTIFTPQLVAVVTLTGVRTARPSFDEVPAGDVDVSIARRDSLRQISLPKPEQGYANHNGAWDTTEEEDEPHWPAYGRIVLSYRDLSQPVVLGGDDHAYELAGALAAFIPRLMTDLSGLALPPGAPEQTSDGSAN